MAYKILGYLVWHGVKFLLRPRPVVPKPALVAAGVGAAALAGVGAAVAIKRGNNEDSQ
ncbi:MAG: hypothetical protein JO321_01630 [Solirubrobacterales bacterium]|nr:hypothetical protein [Solirubrobacterales bacterium]MBV9534092.1 hypothetical protein [Solirubrobacterales bacterium]